MASGCDDVQKLINQLYIMRKKCQQYGNELEASLGKNIVPNDPRYGCFAMIFNKSTLSLELLDFYSRVWKRPFVGSKNDVKKLKQENGQRCIDQTKMLFIGATSSIEFCAKESVKLHPKSTVGQAIIKLAAKRRIYLSDVVRISSNQKLFSKQEKYKWDRLIWLRNILVHNNGIADTDDVYVIDAVKVNLKNGAMIQGNLDIFTNLVESSVELYNSWINSLEKNHK